MGACRHSVVATGTAVGDIAPDFALQDQHGETVHLHDFCDRAVLMIFGAFP
jgi:peroxiredoxin